MSNQERALEIARQIVKLEDELKILRAQFDSMFNAGGRIILPVVTVPTPNAPSIKETVVKILNTPPLRPWSIRELAEAMGGKTRPETISSTASRLATAENAKIKSVGRGQWASVDYEESEDAPF